MKIDVFASTGSVKGSLDLPSAMFEAPINKGLMHLALMRQQSNRRNPIAHVRTRGEIRGSTKKILQQKGSGRARRGPLRSPLMRGGGKAFGPRNVANFEKEMPKKMRRAALFSCLSLRAQEGAIVGLESYPEDVKTKTLVALLGKMKVEAGRRAVIVLPARHKGLELSSRNIPRVKTILATYLNPEDILLATRIIFLVDAIKVAEDTFIKGDAQVVKSTEEKPKKVATKKPAAKKSSPKK